MTMRDVEALFGGDAVKLALAWPPGFGCDKSRCQCGTSREPGTARLLYERPTGTAELLADCMNRQTGTAELRPSCMTGRSLGFGRYFLDFQPMSRSLASAEFGLYRPICSRSVT